MFLYREEYYLEKEMPPVSERTEEENASLEKVKGKTECIISKNRKGPTTNVALTFIPQYTLFKNRESVEAMNQYDGGYVQQVPVSTADVSANIPPKQNADEEAPWES